MNKYKNRVIAVGFAAIFVLLGITSLVCGCANQKASFVANPWQDFSSFDEATEACVSLELPVTLADAELTSFRGRKDQLVELGFAWDGTSYVLRKGVPELDVTEGYDNYPETTTEQVGGIDVTFAGEGEKVFLATWEQGGFSWSLAADRGAPKDALAKIVEGLTGSVRASFA